MAKQKTILKLIKDFYDVIFVYGDKKLLEEYREIFGNSYEDLEYEKELSDKRNGK